MMVEAKEKACLVPQPAIPLTEHELELAKRMLEKEDAIIARGERREALLRSLTR